MNGRRRVILGCTGASGAMYGQRLLEELVKCECEAHVIGTELGKELFAEELGIMEWSAAELVGGRYEERVILHDNDNLYSPPATGSQLFDAMVVCPCSSHSLAGIAGGLGDTLILRAAYVTLKQRRPLILVHREMPLTEIDLENMLKVNRAGGIICPASPAFYLAPETVVDLVNTVVGRVLDLLGLEHQLDVRWNP